MMTVDEAMTITQEVRMAAEMRNFAAVAEKDALTITNAPTVIRSWADRLATHKIDAEQPSKSTAKRVAVLKSADAEDAARLDELERIIASFGGIRLYNGNFRDVDHVGLSLASSGRTLRQALDDARGVAREKGDG